jgi:ribosomal protein L11 methyltransferase
VKKRWLEMTFLVPALWTEILPPFLQEKGFLSLWIETEQRPPHRTVVRAYVPEKKWNAILEEEIQSYFKDLSLLFPEEIERPEIRKNFIEEEDWASSWLPFFEPLKFGSVWIRTTAKPVVLADGEQEIVIDPGQAFGTGHHETTALCLASILRLKNAIHHHAPVLDLGTGSGILAMFAATVGFTNILALDIDPVAIDTAKKNVSSNKLQRFIHVESQSLASVKTHFDLTLANLSASAFLIGRDQIISHMKKGGLLVTSGILADEVKEVRDLFVDMGLVPIQQTVEKEWACIIFKKPEVSSL